MVQHWVADYFNISAMVVLPIGKQAEFQTVYWLVINELIATFPSILSCILVRNWFLSLKFSAKVRGLLRIFTIL